MLLALKFTSFSKIVTLTQQKIFKTEALEVETKIVSDTKII